MMPIPGSSQSLAEITYPFAVKAKWRVREYHDGLLVAEHSKSNLFTDYGLTNLASLWGGAGSAPVYLVIDTFAGTLGNSPLAGTATVQLDQRVDLTGDTDIVLNPGGANEETVSFSGVSGTGPYSYTTSNLVSNHTAGELACRAVRQPDSMASVQAELQYDAAAAPGQRMQAPAGSGFSSGTGAWTMQFFLTGSQALGTGGIAANWMILGLSDNVSVGAGNLHNHLVFGFAHTPGNDVELDITLTITNG